MAQIAVFQHHPLCSRQCALAVAEVLRRDHVVHIIGLTDITPSGLQAYDLLVMPGGDGDADRFQSLFALRRDHVRTFIEQGGAYLGICMGAYWAGSDYLNILDKVDAVQYIRRPGTDTRRPHAKNLPVLWREKPTFSSVWPGL